MPNIRIFLDLSGRMHSSYVKNYYDWFIKQEGIERFEGLESEREEEREEKASSIESDLL